MALRSGDRSCRAAPCHQVRWCASQSPGPSRSTRPHGGGRQPRDRPARADGAACSPPVPGASRRRRRCSGGRAERRGRGGSVGRRSPLREPRTAADGSGYSAVPAGGVDHGFLQARQAANQTASGRPPSITDLTSTDPLPYVAGTPARQGRLRSPWQNCMTLSGGGAPIKIISDCLILNVGTTLVAKPLAKNDVTSAFNQNSKESPLSILNSKCRLAPSNIGEGLVIEQPLSLVEIYNRSDILRIGPITQC